MVQKIKYLTLFVFVIMLTTSCNKWLEIKPQDGLIRQDFWKSKEDVKSAVIGCYTSMLATTQTQFLWGEIRADMMEKTIRTSNEQIDIINANISPTNSITTWRPIYKTINYCNTVIEFAPKALLTDNTFKQADLNGYLAEARALRGYMYMILLKTFGEVPLKLTATYSDAALEQLTKNTQKEVFDQIISDLTFAEVNALPTYGDKAQDKGRITKYSANALLADAYLWMEKYPECIAACDKVINSGKFGLVTGKYYFGKDTIVNTQWFNTVFVQGNSSESIFEYQFDLQSLNPFYSMLASGNKQFVASPRVMEEVYMVDPVDALKYDIRGNLAAVKPSDGTIWKFCGANNAGDIKLSGDFYTHWFVYRYSDILLMKAEALAWTPDKGQEALDLVNVIRKRANALDLTSPAANGVTATDPNALSDYIMQERAREFAFEGKRWYDMLRNAKRNNYANLKWLLDIEQYIADPDKQQFIVNKYKDVRSHYLPINYYELQTDKKLVQNPFYQ